MNSANERTSKWLNNLKSKYDVDIVSAHGGNQFLDTMFTISDPNDKGAAFEIGFNDKGEASMLEMKDFRLGWLNIAEGYRSEDILNVAEAILEAKFKISHTLRKPQICFSLKSTEICGAACTRNTKLPSNYGVKQE
jgi:hypothetical protein